MAKASVKSRYGIYEWFGVDTGALNAAQKKRFFRLSDEKDTASEPCRFAASMASDAICAKPGGVCTIRKFRETDGVVHAVEEVPVTVCPQRFLEDKLVLKWVGEVMLGTRHPIAIREIPFLAKLSKEGSGDDAKKAGRIDWVLVAPTSVKTSLSWCALESQAVYFSGKAMGSEFHQWASAASGKIPFPTEVRRPDYRSSGPKRLAPQLQVKVPELRNWGAKTAVVVDEFFFGQMSDLHELKGDDDADKLANADVVWFVVSYTKGRLSKGRVVYARLDESIKALNATRPVGKRAFELEIRQSIEDKQKQGKRVFKL